MKVRKRYVLAGLVVAGAVGAAVLGVASSSGGSGSVKKDKVTLQLKWVTQAQFAGYYAAKAKGYYSKLGLDVNLKVGGPNITPEVVVASGQAQFGIDWQGSLLSTRDKGGKIINIGQVYTRSGTTELTWRDRGPSSFCKLRGKKVGVWLGGNEFEQYAALRKCGIDPNSKSQVTIFAQPFDMQAFSNR
jgi:NitT/TauT family transport system substrate-binding protein